MCQKSRVDHSREAEALQDACHREGCPVCTVVLEQMSMVMKTWSYEGFTDVEHRQQITQARGFCPLHTWQLTQRNNAFQLAVVYEHVLDVMEHELADEQRSLPQTLSSRDWLTRLRNMLRPDSSSPVDSARLYEQCYFCQARANGEQRLIERLVGLMHTERMASLLRQSTGLCRLHFAWALHSAQEHAAAQRTALIECQQACIQRVLDEVRALIRNHDYRFGQEPRGDEMTAWRRAADLCAGNAGVR
jgi:hypothetical protein